MSCNSLYLAAVELISRWVSRFLPWLSQEVDLSLHEGGKIIVCFHEKKKTIAILLSALNAAVNRVGTSIRAFDSLHEYQPSWGLKVLTAESVSTKMQVSASVWLRCMMQLCLSEFPFLLGVPHVFTLCRTSGIFPHILFDTEERKWWLW